MSTTPSSIHDQEPNPFPMNPDVLGVYHNDGPNLAVVAMVHGALRELVTCGKHLSSLGARGGHVTRVRDTGTFDACHECTHEAQRDEWAKRRREAALSRAGVHTHGRTGDDEGGTIWFAFNTELPAYEPTYDCAPGHHTELCVEDSYRSRPACQLELDAAQDPAVELLIALDIPLWERKCHSGDWDCCGRLFFEAPWVRRSNGWTLVRQGYGRDV